MLEMTSRVTRESSQRAFIICILLEAVCVSYGSSLFESNGRTSLILNIICIFISYAYL